MTLNKGNSGFVRARSNKKLGGYKNEKNKEKN